jgi:signal transduction histidine kinase
MITFLALIIAIVLQFIGAIVALSLTKSTKYSLSWILISIGFLIMAIQRFIEFIPFVWRGWEKDVAAINTWLGIITSVLVAVGLILIKKIFNFIRASDQSRTESEKKVLNAIIQTEERERRRLAKDLHDGLGPLLSTTKSLKILILLLQKLSEALKKFRITLVHMYLITSALPVP